MCPFLAFYMTFYIHQNHSYTTDLRRIGTITGMYIFVIFQSEASALSVFLEGKMFERVWFLCLVYQTYKIILVAASKNVFILNVLR